MYKALTSNRYLSNGSLLAMALLALVTAILGACEAPDRTPPAIVIFEPMYRVPLGGVYEEKGALGTDREDGVLDSTLMMIDASRVRTDSVAEYPVYYFISDAAGNEDSATRMLAVYARPINYEGSWSVRDSCESGITNYSATISASALDSNRILIANFRNRGVDHEAPFLVSGRLGKRLDINDTVQEIVYLGLTDLLYGTLDQMAFDLNIDETDSVGFRLCNCQFRKP